MRPKLALGFLVLIVSSTSLKASSYQGEAKVKGIVSDPNEAVVAGAKISFRTGNIQRHAYSNEVGVFEIQLPAAEYEVDIEGYGFKRLVLKKLELTTGVIKELRITLEALGIPICEPIVNPDQGEQIERAPAPLSEKIKPRKIH